jgi:hypothetical protein
MKKVVYLASLLLMVVAPHPSFPQDKQKPEDRPKAEAQQTTPVKVQIVFTEFENEKKVKSLPYTIYMNAPDAPELKPGWVKTRIGSRVPVYTGGTAGNMTYLDVGTNIDARSAYTGEGRLLLYLILERSWVEGNVSVPVTKSEGPASEAAAGQFNGHFPEPIIRGFKSEFDLKLREGQPVESNMATDPISGKVLKVEISFTTVK